MTLPVWVEYTILAILILAILWFLLAWRREKRKNEYYLEEREKFQTKLDNFYVDGNDREALTAFVADHLDDVTHSKRDDVIRIITKWGSTR